MARLFSLIRRKAVRVLALLVVLLCLAAFAIIQGDALRGKTGLFTMQTAYSVESMQAILAEWGEDGVRAYLNMMYVDFLFPLAYAVALSGAIANLTSHEHYEPGGDTLFLAPLAAGVLDWVENIFHIFMLQQPQALDPLPTLLAALAASAKWALLAVSVAAVVVGVLKWFERRKAQ
ncbi:MAG: hypothetical protein HPY85_16840 [Anaerolineae bacterium]|nr:hypothetical protein [Anaerolineae bacterium]